ncbi:MAG: hypothetical protein BRD49_03160 [Bacteroidetes bacterium SW_10_40_5]|nr:MAG: hypothetical protein BRD49_03160 [Bacteroidetes bacterium SW_10_40_5]
MANRKISKILGNILEHFKEYMRNYAQYFGYLATEKSVKVTAYVLSNFIVALAVGLFLNIIVIALAFYFGYIYDAIESSLLFLAIFYFVLILILILFRRPLIQKPIQKQMLGFIFTDWNKED